jgi:enoyl-CoA hydratase
MDTSTPTEELVLFASNDGVARISINRADKRNALSLAAIEQLLSCLALAERDPSIKVVIFTGVGENAFAAGVDLSELPKVFASAECARQYDERVTRLYRAMETSRLPIIARMAGAAIGGGCLLALACDLRIAASHVKVGFPVSRIGLMLSPHEYRLILDYITLSQSKRLLFTGQLLAGSDAVALGLIDQIVPAEQLDGVVDDLALTIARGAPLAIAASKRISNAICRGEAIEQAISQGYSSIYPSKDLAEGLAAMTEKRAPRFSGE